MAEACLKRNLINWLPKSTAYFFKPRRHVKEREERPLMTVDEHDDHC
ncbi:MAG: hypothetical protein JSV88_13420 [Candidatus Aminicenantes bacterium]|nr:MAG: hypothetical protein JSV88_13420 [Candidatus Aminicenantes bacterium]